MYENSDSNFKDYGVDSENTSSAQLMNVVCVMFIISDAVQPRLESF